MSEPTFAEVLDRAILARGIPLARLSEMLTSLGDPVSVASLSHWRRGQRIPRGSLSLDVIRRLEDILWLEAGSLVSRIPPQRTPGPDGRRLFDEILNERGSRSNAAGLAALLGHDVKDTVVTGAHHTYDIGPERKALRCRCQIFLEARVDGAKAWLLALQFESRPLDQPAVTPVAGARLGGLAYDEQHFTFGAELLFPRSLRRGETTVIEFIVEGLGEAEPMTEAGHVLSKRINEASLWIRFDEKALPNRCREIVDTREQQTKTPTRLEDRSLHRIVRGFGPGRFGFEWSWPR